jgi:hypothetical protein
MILESTKVTLKQLATPKPRRPYGVQWYHELACKVLGHKWWNPKVIVNNKTNEVVDFKLCDRCQTKQVNGQPKPQDMELGWRSPKPGEIGN